MEVERSKLFCLSPGLRVLERQMQEPPGYRPRGYDICIIEAEDWKSRGNGNRGLCYQPDAIGTSEEKRGERKFIP